MFSPYLRTRKVGICEAPSQDVARREQANSELLPDDLVQQGLEPGTSFEVVRHHTDSARNIEVLIVRLTDYVNPTFSSFLAVPHDGVDENVAQAAASLPGIQRIVIRAPNHPATFTLDPRAHPGFLVEMLTCFVTLTSASICINPFTLNSDSILTALRDTHAGLTRLELVALPDPSPSGTEPLCATAESSGLHFQISLIRGLEMFLQLRELAIPARFLSILLLAALGRLPNLRVLKVTSPTTGGGPSISSVFLSNLLLDSSFPGLFEGLERLDVDAQSDTSGDVRWIARRLPHVTIV